MTRELTFTDAEQNMCTICNLIEEDKVYFTTMSGPPLFAVLLAMYTHAPRVTYLIEEGVVGARPELPMPRMMIGASRTHYRALQWGGMNMVDAHAALGFADVGLLAALQVDKHGNFNSTFLGGDYDHPERRFGGPGGANEIASLCWQTVIMTRLEKRKFVERVDFISSPGYLDGSPGARERAGLPAGTGPWKVVTERAVFGFDDKTHVMRLDEIAPWTTVDEVLERMSFQPLIADEVKTMTPPTEEQLELLRSHIDPAGSTLSKGEWLQVTLPD